MRTKDEILRTFQEKEREGIDAVEIMSISQTQLLEVMIDIRDILKEIGKVALGFYGGLVHK